MKVKVTKLLFDCRSIKIVIYKGSIKFQVKYFEIKI